MQNQSGKNPEYLWGMHVVDEHISRIDWSDKKVLVACSGGMDSVVLAHALFRNRIPFALLHVNYQLRGEESDLDEQAVRDLATQLAVPVLAVKCPTAITKADGANLQNEARKFRRTLFNQWKAISKQYVVALAHHRDDQVETFFLQYFRGSHMIGLKGMLPENDQLVRPFLALTKSDLTNYALENQLSWREDQSNASNNYARNVLRNELLPALRKTISTLDDAVLIVQHAFQQTLNEERKALPVWIQDAVISTDQWNSLSETQKTLLLRMKQLPQWSLQRIEQLFGSEFSTAVEAGNFRLIRIRSGILFQAQEGVSRNWEFKVEDVKKLSKNLSNDVLYCYSDLIQRDIEIRGARSDDKIALPGISGRKSVWEMLKDQGIPAQLRGNQPVFVVKNEVVWVPGFAVSKNVLVKNGSSSIVKITLIEKFEQISM